MSFESEVGRSLSDLRRYLRGLRAHLTLTAEAKRMARQDKRGLPDHDPGPGVVVQEGVAWLLRAQAASTTADGGVSRHYSFLTGWDGSYPETTGYIVPTLLEHAERTGAREVEAAAVRMLDFLVDIQTADGGWCGGMVHQAPQRPVSFNTGQILLGMAAGARRFEPYREPMIRAAEWLTVTQDPDGAWRRHPSPFAAAQDHVFDTHISWGLLEAARVAGSDRFAHAARANIEWAMARQVESGWYRDCCLNNSEHPLTHTIGYALRGIVEGYRFFREEAMLRSAVDTADALGSALQPDGFLSGRFDSAWRPRADWACLTGTSQIALCWMILHEETGEARYLEFARRANAYVRRTVDVSGPLHVRGGVKGSFPVWGDYGRYELPNWACKFTVDANRMEMDLVGGSGSSGEAELREGQGDE